MTSQQSFRSEARNQMSVGDVYDHGYLAGMRAAKRGVETLCQCPINGRQHASVWQRAYEAGIEDAPLFAEVPAPLTPETSKWWERYSPETEIPSWWAC